MKVIKISLISLSVIILALVILLTSLLDGVVKKTIVSVAPNILGVNVALDDVDISIINGRAKISGLSIGNPAGFKSERAFYLGEVDIDLEPLSLFSDVIKINHIKITEPEITYEIGAGKTNLGQLTKNIGNKTTSEEIADQPKKSNTASEGESSKKVIIGAILVSGAKVQAGVGQVTKEVPLPDIKIQDIGTEGQPTSFASATKKLLSAVIIAVSQADLNGLSGGALKTLEDAGGSITKGIKGLFK